YTASANGNLLWAPRSPATACLSPAALAADLGRLLRHEPILARRIGPLGRLARWIRRNRAVATATAAALAVLVVVSGLLPACIVAETGRRHAGRGRLAPLAPRQPFAGRRRRPVAAPASARSTTDPGA